VVGDGNGQASIRNGGQASINDRGQVSISNGYIDGRVGDCDKRVDNGQQ